MSTPQKNTTKNAYSDTIGNQKKIHVINMKLRQSWSKYDKDLQHVIFDKSLIAKVIQNCFIDAMLQSDYENLILTQEQQNLDKLIYEEAKIFDYEKVNKDQKGIDMKIQLNQVQIVNIVKRLYADPTAIKPQGQFVYPVGMRKKNTIKKPASAVSKTEDYVEYYQKVKHLAEEKNWSESQFQKMLGDKKAFEREWNSYYRQKKKFVQGDRSHDDVGIRLHEAAMERKEKHARLKQIKDIEEIESAYMMAQIPKTKPLPQYYDSVSELNASRMRQGEVRTLEQFIEDQKKFEHKKQNNIINAIMKEESEETYVFAPQITQKSIQILRSRDNSLGSSIIQKRKNEYLETKSKEETFKPKINQKSNDISSKYQSSTNTLYQDAQRRQSQHQTIESIMSQKAQADQNTTQICAASDKFIYEKFDNDFTLQCLNMGVYKSGDDQPGEKMIDCPKTSWLFLNMGFVKAKGSDEDQALLANIWRQIGGDEDGKSVVPLQFVKVFMCAILNFHIDWIIDNEREDQPGVNPNSLGRIYGKTLLLKSDEITYITKKYVKLYKNRQDKLQDEIREKKQRKAIQRKKLGEQPTFQPQQQSAKSRQFAMSATKKDPRRMNMSVSDRLYQENFDLLEKKEKMAKEKEDKDRAQKFKPTVSEYNTQLALNSRKSIALRSLSNDMSKWDNFYMDHKTKLNKRDVDNDEQELLKNKNEYTFKPHIPRQSLRPLLEKEYQPYQSQRTEKFKQRMSLKPGLDMGNKKKKRTESLKSAYYEESSQSSNYEIRTLQISVNIGGSKKQIQANVEDDAEDIATRFIKEHQIDDKYHAVLTKLIDQQIRQFKDEQGPA